MPEPSPPPSLIALLRSTAAFHQASEELCRQLAALTTELSLQPGDYLAREGDAGDALFLIVSGSVLLTRHSAAANVLPAVHAIPQRPDLPDQPLSLGTVGPGQIVGELSLLTGHPRAATMQATEPTLVRALARSDFDQLCAQFPQAMAATITWMAERLDAYQITTAIEESPLLGTLTTAAKSALAAACTRTSLTAGQPLFTEGEPGNALYLILSGRIRIQRGPASTLLAELGKGDILGELALLTGEPRSATAIAVRDSHLACLSREVFDRIVAAHPIEILSLFNRQLASRLRTQNITGGPRKLEGRPPVAIAVLPLSPSEQTGSARDFAAELVRQLSAFGPTLHLNRTVIDRVIRTGSASGGYQLQASEVADRRLLAWLDELELLYRHVVYEADYQSAVAVSAWTARCLRQADMLLVVASGPADPQQSEETMVRLTQKAVPNLKTTLVLIHPDGPGTITHTARWKRVLGFSAHEHVHRDSRGQHDPRDVGRIARALNGKSVGLALGGGFALGLAHIGVVDAMRDLDIPIDFVGGTSMGAILAAAAAQRFTHAQMLEVMDKGCAQALKGDYTLPIVSLLTGRKVGLALGKYLEHLDIEDLWLPYFAVSASLVHARMVVHRQGSALRSVVASCRAPGMFPPLGWDGDVLVDGGLVNNIPADVMRESVTTAAGNGIVFAADVSPAEDFACADQFGMELSGWKVARSKFRPPAQRMPTLAEILMRLIRLGGVAHKQQIHASADLYLSIPLQQFSVRDFHRGEEMSQVAYQHARQTLHAWIEKNGRPWLGNADHR